MAHKHLFTPRDWCMIPYCARFGLTKEKVKSEPLLESVIMDQYVRDCGYEPTESWILVVNPDGRCEFTEIDSSDPAPSAAEIDLIQARIAGPVTAALPPYLASTENTTTKEG